MKKHFLLLPLFPCNETINEAYVRDRSDQTVLFLFFSFCFNSFIDILEEKECVGGIDADLHPDILQKFNR